MVKLPTTSPTPFQILGVPSFATAAEIEAAYTRRIKVLAAYRYDKSKEPAQWAAVNEIVQEVHLAYASLVPLDPSRPIYQISPDSSEPAAKIPLLDPETTPEDKALSHIETTENAVRTYRTLASNLDEKTAQTKFIELIATRGFTESQPLPPIARQPAPPK